MSETEQAYMVPLNELVPNPFNPRRTVDGKGIEELADSIRRHGFLGALEGRRKDGRVELAYGARRLEAARRAGLTAVPVILRDWDDDKMREVALVENLQREDLNPLEEARGLADLMETHGYSQEQAARALGKSQGYISQRLLLLRMHPEVQKALGDGEITATHARALAGIPAEHQPAVLKAISGLSTRKAQNLIEALSQALSSPEWWMLPEDAPYITRNLAVLILHCYRGRADNLVPWLIALREEGILKPLPALARTLEREPWHARVLFRAGDTQKAWEDMVREEHPDWVCENCRLRTRTHLVGYVEAYTASSAPRCGLRFPDGRTCPAYLGTLPARIEVAVNRFFHVRNVPAEVSDLDELEPFVAEEQAAGESKRQGEMEQAAEEIRRRVETYWAFREVEHPAAQTCVRCLHHKVGAAGREACEFGNSPPANRWERPSFRLWVREDDGLRVPRCSRFEYKSVEAIPSVPVSDEVEGLLRTTAYYFLKRSAQSPSPLRVLVQQAGGIREFLYALPVGAAAALVLEEAMSDLIEGAWIRGETRVLPGSDGNERWKEERLEE